MTDAKSRAGLGEHAISVRDLGYRFGRRRALSEVAFTLDGGVVGLLGPNGAGKSTLLGVLATVLPTRSGRVMVHGNDVGTRSGRAAARARLGWLPQHFDLAPGMTLHDTVSYAAWSQGADAGEVPQLAASALDIVDLAESRRARVRTLSGGQRQRLGLACAIAHRPEVLLLDEPSVGLDPEQRVHFREALTATSRGRTVVLSSHLLDDIAASCDRVLVLDGGRIRFDGTPASLAGLARDDNGRRGASDLETGYLRVLSTDRERDAR